MTAGPQRSARQTLHFVGRGAGLFTLLILTQLVLTQLVASEAAAGQVPIVLERKEAIAYVPYAFNYTEFSVPVVAGDYAFVGSSRNPGDTESEVWVRQGSRIIWHGTVGSQTIRLLELQENATYTISINGRGTFALTDISLMNRMLSAEPLNERMEFGQRFAVILHYTADRTVCLRSDAPGRWTIWDRTFSESTTPDLSNWTRVVLEGLYPQWVFYDGLGGPGGTLRVTDADSAGECKGDQPVAPSHQPTPSRSNGSPGAGFGWALLAALVLLAGRRM